MAVARPGMCGQYEAMACVAKTRLQLFANGARDQVAGHVARAVEDQASLTFPAVGSRQRFVQTVHGVAVSILEGDVVAVVGELVVTADPERRGTRFRR